MTGFVDGVSSSGSSDAWAVVDFNDSRKPRTLHWDGMAWKSLPNPAPYGLLTSINALSPNDVWAVGSGTKLITEHWDGSVWTRILAPSPADFDQLIDVSASSPTEVWAVGYFWTDHTHPFAERWDGAAWTISYTPSEIAGLFTGVTAISSTDVWAVGYQDLGLADFQPLVEHWDGVDWAVVSTPPLNGTNNFLHQVSAGSATDVWAVGSYRPGATDEVTADLPLTLHWDGISWTEVPAPSVGDQGDVLVDVAVISSTDIWGVGSSYFSVAPTARPLALHWDGLAWKASITVTPGDEPAGFLSTAASGPRDVWAVGSSASETRGVLIEHSKGACASSDG